VPRRSGSSASRSTLTPRPARERGHALSGALGCLGSGRRPPTRAAANSCAARFALAEPPGVYRRLLAPGLGPAEVAAAPDALTDALRLSARRPSNARTITSLMHRDHPREASASSSTGRRRGPNGEGGFEPPMDRKAHTGFETGSNRPNRPSNKGVARRGNGRGNETSSACNLRPLGVGEISRQLRPCPLDVLGQRVRVPRQSDLRSARLTLRRGVSR
jgi:hypothetical protein